MRDITNELRLATVDYADAFIDEGLPSLCDRAADEIDRLRAALATAQAERDAALAERDEARLEAKNACNAASGAEHMKDASNVVPNYAPVYAAALYPDLARLCIAHGYALAVHGSLARDFDVIAIPWAEPLAEPQEVIDAITREFVIREVGSRGHRLYGRLVYTLSIGHGECAVDFSFAPKGTHEAEAALNAERLEVIAAIARKEAAQAENATLREQLAAAQRHIADLTDELYEAQNNPSYDGPSRVVATKRGHCTCWLGTDAAFGSSEARMRCAVHGDPPRNVFTQGEFPAVRS